MSSQFFNADGILLITVQYLASDFADFFSQNEGWLVQILKIRALKQQNRTNRTGSHVFIGSVLTLALNDLIWIASKSVTQKGVIIVIIPVILIKMNVPSYLHSLIYLGMDTTDSSLNKK